MSATRRTFFLLGPLALLWGLPLSASAAAQDPPPLITAQQCRAQGGTPVFRLYGGGDAYRCVRRAAGAGPASDGVDPGFAYVRRPAFHLDYLAPGECQAAGGALRWQDAGGGMEMCRGGVYDGKPVLPAMEQTD